MIIVVNFLETDSKPLIIFWQFIEIRLKSHRILPLQICGLRLGFPICGLQLGFQCLLAILLFLVSTQISYVLFSSKFCLLFKSPSAYNFKEKWKPKLSDKNLYCFLPPIYKLNCNYTISLLCFPITGSPV